MLSDPQFLILDAGAPSNHFDGLGGSLLSSYGWDPAPVSRSASGGVIGSSWAMGGEAELYFPGLPSPEIDFYGRGQPFSYPHAPPQAIDFTLDGIPAGRVDVPDGTHAIRAPLSVRVSLGGGLHHLVLRFARAKSPAEVGLNPDARVLCMNFSVAAIIPREVRDAEGYLQSNDYDPKKGILRISEGSSVAIPVPAESTLSFHLGNVEASCEGCSLLGQLVAGDSVKTVFEARIENASGRHATFDTNGLPIGRLVLSLRDSSGRLAFDPSRAARVEVPKNFLVVKSRAVKARARPDLFIYLVDTLRADALEPYGSHRPESPAAARFAKDAVVYEKSWATSTWTLPSIVSILSGVYLMRHGINGDYRYEDKEIPSLAGVLGHAGYDTVGISQSEVASRDTGVDAGFSTFFVENQVNAPELRSQEIRAYLVEWLARGSPERPTFAYIHTVDPHSPYTPRGRYLRFAREAPGGLPPENYNVNFFSEKDLAGNAKEVAHLRALYDGEVLYADEQFGRFLDLLKWLGRYDDSAIVLVADHGEEFTEHGGFDHGDTVYEELVRVPLIVRYPGSRWAGMRVLPRVSTLDIYPTLLDLAGVGWPRPGLDGRPLLPPPEINRHGSARPVYSEVRSIETSAEVVYRAVAIGRLKGIESAAGIDQFCRPVPAWRVFDLEHDPGERAPLSAGDPRSEECWQALNGWLVSEQKQAHSVETDERRVDAQSIRKLRALGYLR